MLGFKKICKKCGCEWISMTKHPKTCSRILGCGSATWETGVAKRGTHHGTGTRLYKKWHGLRGRCSNPNNKRYPRYGGRGIKVCERWLKFENFRDDMSEPPSPQHTLDRIDNDGDYSPENCRWATYGQQYNNRGDNRRLTYKGLTLTATEWAARPEVARLGITRSHIYSRVGVWKWTAKEALTTPTTRVGGSFKHRRTAEQRATL